MSFGSAYAVPDSREPRVEERLLVREAFSAQSEVDATRKLGPDVDRDLRETGRDAQLHPGREEAGLFVPCCCVRRITELRTHEPRDVDGRREEVGGALGDTED